MSNCTTWTRTNMERKVTTYTEIEQQERICQAVDQAVEQVEQAIATHKYNTHQKQAPERLGNAFAELKLQQTGEHIKLIRVRAERRLQMGRRLLK